MKKSQYLLALCAAFALVLSSCGSDDEPTVIPSSAFTSDRAIVEVAEAVTFANTSTDAISFSWDFGDNQTSTDENPVHEYEATGTYTVTLTSTSSSGDEATSTTTVTVGVRTITTAEFTKMNFEKSELTPWDDDGTGPDVLFGFATSASTSISLLGLADDLEEASLPVGGQIPASAITAFTDEDWDFILIDNDVPLDDVNESELMFGVTLNPVTVSSEKNYETGEGSFTIDLNGFIIIISFMVQ